jgi:8-oxo-dGTP pyrophosphatase MutT (NUDIX family)
MPDTPRSLRHAVVVLIRDGDDVLMMQRAATDSYPGYWSSVTGSMEPGETQMQACIREAREEVGLEVRPVRKLWESMTRRAHFLLHGWECELVGPRTVKLDAAEVADCQWLPLQEAAGLPLMFSDTRYFLREVLPQIPQP